MTVADPGDEPRPALFQPSLTHFSLVPVKNLVGSRPWSQRSQGWVLWSFLQKAVPLWNGPKEESLLSISCPVGWNVRGEVVRKVRKVLSRAPNPDRVGTPRRQRFMEGFLQTLIVQHGDRAHVNLSENGSLTS